MSRTGELSEHNVAPSVGHFIQTIRGSNTGRRGDNKISLWDGKLEDSIASSRESEFNRVGATPTVGMRVYR